MPQATRFQPAHRPQVPPGRGTGPHGRGRSLRSRWTRAFALLTTLVVLSGVASLLGTRSLVDIFHTSAVRVESQATLGAHLRAEIIADSVVLASPVTPAQKRQAARGAVTIRGHFAEALAAEDAPAARRLLKQSQRRWQALLTAAAAPADLATRGTAVSADAPQILALLDRAGATSRDAVRLDLRSASRAERGTMAVLTLLELLAILLAVQLYRRMSSDVLRPVGILRDSANHLAAGELDHRVLVDRADELGELAVAFNAMADAIAGSQRTLTLEATTDSLSGLANRAAFRSRLEETLSRPDRRGRGQAVLFVDLDDFKDVNDSLGHAAGDELLRVVARRLVDTLRPSDLVARLGGDEFAILIDDLVEPALGMVVAERVVTALAEPIMLGKLSIHVGASVGMALRHPRSTLDGLMREADVAMYAAKGKGKNRVEKFDAELDDLTTARHLLKVDLDGAADRGELVVDYQPIVDLTNGRLLGLEALVRWQHPTRGLLPPSAFIEAAEETGAIVGIGSHVLETAAAQVVRWQREYRRPDLSASVNVSVCQLERPGFADKVKAVLRSTGLDPASLVIEVTETVLADPDGEAAGVLTALRQTGVRVALDDFGTGYSSIGYLRMLPVDVLKIDRSFLAGTEAGGPGHALLGAIVAMANSLGLEVVAEGIEEHDQVSRLTAMGCHVGQGFLMARPGPAAAIDGYLASPLPLPYRRLRGVVDALG
jgi:diguanylate cyclase (GGDEF)-like protein